MRILIVDIHPILRKGISSAINSYFKDTIIKETESFAAFQHTNVGFEPELVIFGLNRVDDLGTVGLIRQKYPHVGLIIHADHFHRTILFAYVRAEINGYLPRQAGAKELTDCIEQVLSGKKYIDNELLFELILNEYPLQEDFIKTAS